MKILLTGANGYIGKRLLPVLLDQGHHVICCVRDARRFWLKEIQHQNLEILEIDFLKESEKYALPSDIDIAYYLIHSMAASIDEFDSLEQKAANNFCQLLNDTKAQQVIYLSGIANEDHLSKHLGSRKNVESILLAQDFHATVLRAGIIVGSGSASFEIIRDLVEKLPVMITPKWVLTRCQPIAIRDVIKYLSGVQLNEECYNEIYDIGGPEIMTYKEMMLQFAIVRGLKRLIISVPVMTPRLSSYWLYFVTATSYRLAVNLVDSMKVEVICKDDRLEKLLGIKPISYRQAIEFAFEKIEQNLVLSSWKDAISSSRDLNDLSDFINVPEYGCFTDHKQRTIGKDPGVVLNNIWSIGGERGWFYGNILWKIRGWVDKMVGGVGLRRGRTHPSLINAGDALDFWRVVYADKSIGKLLLFAEMKLPGEAWLEFKVVEENNQSILHQTATFRPKGLIGRIYWYCLVPFHYFVFNGMIRNLVKA